MSSRPKAPKIVVLAGTNGAGKSSVAGAALRSAGGVYFNPDEVSKTILRHNPSLSITEANSLAWQEGLARLTTAIGERTDYSFETTLGGNTIPSTLLKAANLGIDVRVWYVGLTSADLHVERVMDRVARGGHDIPEDRIRARYVSSRKNLITLLPHLSELKLFDNSAEGDPANGDRPQPKSILHLREGALVAHCPPEEVPEWAKPIVAAVARLLKGA